MEYLSFADNVHSVAPEMAEDDDSECGDADLFQCVEFEQSKIVKQQEQEEKQRNDSLTQYFDHGKNRQDLEIFSNSFSGLDFGIGADAQNLKFESSYHSLRTALRRDSSNSKDSNSSNGHWLATGAEGTAIATTTQLPTTTSAQRQSRPRYTNTELLNGKYRGTVKNLEKLCAARELELTESMKSSCNRKLAGAFRTAIEEPLR